MGLPLDDELRQALEAPTFWHLATVNPDGSPQSTAVWVHTRDNRILVNTAIGRKKYRNITRDPRVALSFHETTEQGYRSWGLQGRAVETIVGEQAEADIDMLAQKYIGVSPYPWRSPGERRVTFLIELTHAFLMG
ncbi:MAG: PPOX class F420-dependent oxidoreductase [Thermoleophilia bacterium]